MRPSNLVGSCRKDEIVLAQAADRVGPDLDNDFSPTQVDLRVMPLFLRHRANTVGEIQGFLEVAERVRLPQVMLLHHVPAGAQLLAQASDRLPLERGRPFRAWFALLSRKVGCRFHLRDSFNVCPLLQGSA
jgi:hypothetical protein